MWLCIPMEPVLTTAGIQLRYAIELADKKSSKV
jgi:hypothetical protein